MTLYGSAINFFGGPGESFHKKFAKDTGHNTQLRIDEFTPQIAKRCHETMVLELAQSVHQQRESERYISNPKGKKQQGILPWRVNDLWFLGKHGLYDVRRRHIYKGEIDIPLRFYQGIIKHVFENTKNIEDVSFIGYTSAKVHLDDRDVIFRCSSRYNGRTDWHNWCFV
ncbi:hypothetical protein ACHAWF_010169 [Thalassiosira exigua]